MKIAFFSDCYLDLVGGIPTVINSEKQELERRGHTVYIFSSAYPKSAAEQKKLAKSHIYPVPSHRVLGRGFTPIARRPGIIEKWLLDTHPELKEFDVFYVHYEAGCSIAGLRLGRQLGIPTVQVMHGREDVGVSNIIPRGLRTLTAILLNRLHSWYLSHPVKIMRDDCLAPTLARARMWELMVNHANAADLVITPSDFFGQMLAHYGVTRPIKPLHHALAAEYIEASVLPHTLAPGQPLEITWHARLSPEKRPLAFLEALASVKAPYHVTMYGAGSEMRRAKAYVAKHRLNVTFRGTTSFRQIWQGLAHAHLDVLTSYDFDTFGMTMIESQAAGVPVLICDPNLQEIVPSDGYLLAKSPAPADLARAIDDLATHPERVAKMSRAMLRDRTHLAIQYKIDRLEQIFNDIIKS